MVLPGKIYKPEDFLWMVWRRKWAVIIPFLVIVLGTFGASLTVPDRFRSETVILVVPQRVPENYVRSTVTTRIEDRLRSIEQQIRSRTRLELIIRDFNLYPAERGRMAMEDVVELMRRDVAVNIVRGDAFRVAYTSDDPRKAMQVAERLASEFTNESLQDREVLATATTDFLQSQLDDARRRLAEQEARVADFQRRHAGQLPSERESNLQVLHNLQLQVQAVLDSANRERDRRLFLERTLAELEPQTLAAPKVATPTSPSAAANPADATTTAATAKGTTEEQLEAARAALKSLELHLKPAHPDVLYVKRLIRDLEAKVQTEASAQPASTSAAGASPRPRTAEETATLRRVKEIREEIASVDIQISSKQAEESRLRDQISQFQGRVAATPALEAELTALTRDYDTQRKMYESLLGKQEESKVSAALERRQIGEVFKVLDPARLPEGPASPNRFLINLLGALAGLALGLGLVALLEYRDQGLRSEEDVYTVLHVPVLASIPVIETRAERRRRRRNRVIGFVSATAVVVVVLGAALAAWSAGVIRLPLLFR
jgi:polysaccharide chain length determinant protein (PEP-CTERM system associated)